MSDTINYTDPLPISQEWAEEHEGQTVAVEFTVGFGELVDFEGIEGLNDYVDETAGVILTGLCYDVLSHDGNYLTVRATGELYL